MRTIVMTGGSSGFGAIAADRIRQYDDNRLILGARRESPAGESLPLDLATLDSVRSFAASVRERLGETPIDALVLNAGMINRDADGRTVDGFETVFAVNHVASYLLVRLLLPQLADGATVVLTSSGTHDPATGSHLATPRHADAELLAHPDRDPDRDPAPRKAGQHAYTASKLCAVLTARWMNRHTEATAIAYCPGQVFGTGLVQRLGWPQRIAWSVLGTPLGRPLRRFDRNLNGRDDAGNTLAGLALGLIRRPEGQEYAALRRGRLTWPDLSELARDDELAEALWLDTARLVGPTDR